MLLAVDIGNTNITLGVFENESILETFRLPSDKELPQEEYEILLHTLFKKYDINACIIASVVDELNRVFKHAADNITFPLFVSDCATFLIISITCSSVNSAGMY